MNPKEEIIKKIDALMDKEKGMPHSIAYRAGAVDIANRIKRLIKEYKCENTDV